MLSAAGLPQSVERFTAKRVAMVVSSITGAGPTLRGLIKITEK